MSTRKLTFYAIMYSADGVETEVVLPDLKYARLRLTNEDVVAPLAQDLATMYCEDALSAGEEIYTSPREVIAAKAEAMLKGKGVDYTLITVPVEVYDNV